MTKTWVIFLAVTLFVVVAWVGSAIYYAKPNKLISAEVQAALEPLNPEFDIPTLKEIEIKVKTTIIASPSSSQTTPDLNDPTQ